MILLPSIFVSLIPVEAVPLDLTCSCCALVACRGLHCSSWNKSVTVVEQGGD